VARSNLARVRPSAVFAVVLLAFSSCGRPPADSLAIIDPAFAYLTPEARPAFSRVARKSVWLPESEAQAALYAALDADRPALVYLTPLVSSELASILARDEGCRVAILGGAAGQAHPRLAQAAFSSSDAARLGAAALEKAVRGLKDAGPETVVVALFSGPVAESDAPEAFRTAFEASGVAARLRLERLPEAFSQAVAERLRAEDVRAAYVSASASDLHRWAELAFDEYAYIIAEAALPDRSSSASIDRYVCWDIEASLLALADLLASGEGGTVAGLWKTASPRSILGYVRR